MPPKKQQTKNEKKKKEKDTDDKTFGMKNKNKSAKVQRYIQQVQTQAKHNATQGLKVIYNTTHRFATRLTHFIVQS
jgi:hypothetical protein